jgi:hypothetical protein
MTPHVETDGIQIRRHRSYSKGSLLSFAWEPFAFLHSKQPPGISVSMQDQHGANSAFALIVS